MNRALGTHLVILIDRELQKQKSILTASGLIAAPEYEYMQYNLQYGEILSVGEGITDPAIQAGRRAIIHHTIESDDRYLIEERPNGDQVRWLNTVSTSYNYKLFGVLDEGDDIIPLEQFVFCDPEPVEELQYEHMVFGTDTLRFSTEKVGELYLAHVPKKEEEKKYVSPVIAAVSPFEKQLRVGQQVLAQDFTRYPIDLLGRQYLILSREFIVSIVKP